MDRKSASSAGGKNLIPGGGIKIPCATWCSQKTEEETTVLPPRPHQENGILSSENTLFFNSNYEGKWTNFFLIKKFFLAVLCGIQDLGSPTRN